jgi:hypothetical protein
MIMGAIDLRIAFAAIEISVARLLPARRVTCWLSAGKKQTIVAVNRSDEYAACARTPCVRLAAHASMKDFAAPDFGVFGAAEPQVQIAQ